jgi:DNA-binding CsgD family transcriptional regulator
MAEAKLHIATRATLRVAVATGDPVRHATLTAMVAEMGHIVCDSRGAEIVLAHEAALLPELPAVVLGGVDSEHAGILAADADGAQIDAALRAVATGLIVRHSPQRHFSALEERDVSALLTPRELEVLVGLSEGLSNKAIARQLDISQHTVKFHVESIFRKLGVTTRAEAVAKGLRHGLVHL